MHLARRCLVRSPVSYALKSSTLFCIDKARKRGCIEHRVVNHNFRNALTLHYNFGGYFTSSSNLFYERWIYCFFHTFSSGVQASAVWVCIARNAISLSALRAKVEVADFNACGRTTALQLYMYLSRLITLTVLNICPVSPDPLRWAEVKTSLKWRCNSCLCYCN